MTQRPVAPRRLLRSFASTLAAVVLLHATAHAQWPPDASSGLPICTLSSNESLALVAGSGVGGAIIVWRDDRVFFNYPSVYAQRVDVVGNRPWGTNGIEAVTSIGSRYPECVLPDGAGGVFIAMTDTRASSAGDVYMQRLDINGAAVWGAGGVPACTATGSQYLTQMVSDGAGGVIVAWIDMRAGSSLSTIGLYAQRFNAAGVPQWAANGVPVTNAVGQFYNGIRLASDGNGGVVMTWSSFVDIWGQRLDANGNRLWGANGVGVCTLSPSQQDHAVITTDGAAGAIIAWWDSRPGSSGLADVYGQRINAAGAPVWTLDGKPIAAAANAQREVELVSDGAGGAIAVWHDSRFSPSPPTDLYAQRIDPNGDPLWTAGGVRITPSSTLLSMQRLMPTVVADGGGGAVICWKDSRAEAAGDLYATRLNALGQFVWSPNTSAVCLATNQTRDPSLAMTSDGAFIVAWPDFRSGSQTDIYAHRIGANGELGPPLPTPAMASLSSVIADPGRVRLSGYAVDLGATSLTLERSDDGELWVALATLALDGSGQFAYDDRTVSAGQRYAYRISLAEGGSVRHTPATWVQVPLAVEFGLALTGAQPSSGQIDVMLSLSDGGDARLELFDLSGRRIESQVVVREATGVSRATLGRGRSLAPGVYLVRLARGAEQRMARAVVAR